ncbi:hypothetical protein B0J11DRAFT_539046 [Dendryphion nanum]|uniref:F-box domain-containing protein n=1 Tax=Dendryphion nanum TaxID=256645 RepID=A0A9P9DBR9_9PLEO|nr:hypothetical protein B0J11DRAFT_539046 [Dendryphion nanum]
MTESSGKKMMSYVQTNIDEGTVHDLRNDQEKADGVKGTRERVATTTQQDNSLPLDDMDIATPQWQSADILTATRRVLQLPEVIEIIFVHVPGLDVIRNCRLVSRFWNNLIQTSPLLQKHCWITPATSDDDDPFIIPFEWPSTFLESTAAPPCPFKRAREEWFGDTKVKTPGLREGDYPSEVQEAMIEAHCIIHSLVPGPEIRVPHNNMESMMKCSLHSPGSTAHEHFRKSLLHPLTTKLPDRTDYLQTCFIAYRKHIVLSTNIQPYNPCWPALLQYFDWLYHLPDRRWESHMLTKPSARSLTIMVTQDWLRHNVEPIRAEHITVRHLMGLLLQPCITIAKDRVTILSDFIGHMEATDETAETETETQTQTQTRNNIDLSPGMMGIIARDTLELEEWERDLKNLLMYAARWCDDFELL